MDHDHGPKGAAGGLDPRPARPVRRHGTLTTSGGAAASPGQAAGRRAGTRRGKQFDLILFAA
jgi:hypothetical protein